MKPEIEAKFLDVNHEVIREMLQRAGATCEQPMRLMRRAIIEFPGGNEKDAFVRVRNEGDKTTLTYKQFAELSVDGAREIETTVGSFDDTVALFQAIGMPAKSIQESKRETWRLEDVKVVLDEWPWLNPYIEIEGPSQASLEAAAILLGLRWADAVFGDVMVAYRAQYPHFSTNDTVARLPEVTFGAPIPDMLRS